MITPAYCRLMARYNTGQNTSLVTAADGLWLARFAGDERPEDTIAPALDSPSGWEDFKALRWQRDAAVERWAADLDVAALSGVTAWYPAGGSQRIEKPTALCVVHLFNHQTHHRGQVHAMLTPAGARPEPTDLPMMP